MIVYVNYSDYYKFYSIVNKMFAKSNGKHISQYVKISCSDKEACFEYFNEKDYLQVKCEADIDTCGSVLVDFDTLKIINSLKGDLKINYKEDKKTVVFSDNKKALNVPSVNIDFEIQHPYGKETSFDVNAFDFFDKIKFIKDITSGANVMQGRFKNILISNDDSKCKMIAANGHLLTMIKLLCYNIKGGKFFIPRSLIESIVSLKKMAKKDTNIKISNFDSYHCQIQFDGIKMHSLYEDEEFFNYEKWQNVNLGCIVQVKKVDLEECLKAAISLKPYLNKVDFSLSDKYLKFYSMKSGEVDIKTLIDVKGAKNPKQYSGSFDGKEIDAFISRLSDEEDVFLCLDETYSTNVIKAQDSTLVCNVLTMRGV